MYIKQVFIVVATIAASSSCLIIRTANCSPISLDPLATIMPANYHQFGQVAPPAPPIFAPTIPIGDYSHQMKAAQQFPLGSPFLFPPLDQALQFDATRRSFPSFFKTLSNNKQHSNKQSAENKHQTDEQKALSDLPVSFLEPDVPSSLTERLSESFGVLNEGVKNHFRSIQENFVDTFDELKDTWSSAKKRA